MTAARIFVPDYALDLQTARIDPGTDDWVAADLAAIMMTSVVSAAALALHDRAGRPATVAYVCDSAHLRVLTGHFSIAGRRSQFVEAEVEKDKVQRAIADLLARKIELLATRRPYQPGPPMTGVASVMMVRPTRLREPFLAFLTRLTPAEDGPAVTIIDLADNIARHGTPPGWQVETVVGETRLVVAEPTIDRLTTKPAASAQAWAAGDRGRLTLIAAARGYKPGWIEHSAAAWIDRQVRGRSRQSTPLDRRPGREARAQPPP